MIRKQSGPLAPHWIREADITQARPLSAGLRTGAALGDDSYDIDHFIAWIEALGTKTTIPPRRNYKRLREYDRHLCNVKIDLTLPFKVPNTSGMTSLAMKYWLATSCRFSISTAPIYG